MSNALEQLNYEGTLLQLHGAEVAVMRIVHRVEDGVSMERITAMDEVGREIIRRGDDVTCILPDQRSVMMSKRGQDNRSDSPLRSQFALDPQFDDRFYRLAIASGERLLGRATRLVTVQPADGFRYGYRLWLDEGTAMPLKIQITGEESTVIEQLLFSDIRLPERIPEAETRPSRSHDNYTVRDGSASSSQLSIAGGASWQVGALPPGFRLRAVRTQAANGGEPIQQLVYTDGVATVSVFVESDVEAAEQGEGPSRMGAANAYTTLRDGHMVTAVGDVPLRTVEGMARSAEPPAAVAARR
jgi:sigma-E factor negative regulatory protein RseB